MSEDKKFSFYLTRKELQACLDYSEQYGAGDFNTMFIHVDTSGAIGDSVAVSQTRTAVQTDVTEYEAW